MHTRSLLLAGFLGACGPEVVDEGPADVDLTFLPDAGPSFVAEGAVGEDGLLLDRIEVVLGNRADADTLDAVLEAVDGTLLASRPGLPWLSVGMPVVADLAAAEAVAEAARAVPGVVYAGVAHEVLPSLPAAAPAHAAPAGVGGSTNPSLGLQRFYAAWNVASLATGRQPVWIVDAFLTAERLPELSALRFVGPAAPNLAARDSRGRFVGNHGHWVASLLAADAGERPPAGTHPSPADTLDPVAINHASMGGLVDEILALDRLLPTDEPFVLTTSFGAADSVPRERRVLHAVMWREVLLARPVRFLHTTSAGNEGILTDDGATFNSAFTIQSRFDDLGTAVADASSSDLQDVLEDARERRGAAFDAVVGHTLVVGASDAEGVESTFSNRGTTLRMIGEGLTGVCARADGRCVENRAFGLLMTAPGTSGSTPMLAGLAAWARALEPTLDAPTLAGLLQTHFDGRWVDALAVTLALESPTLPIRRTLLDVLGDGAFEAQDIDAVLQVIDLEEEAHPDVADATPTWSRTDLNGDGYTRSDTTSYVDLDGDGQLGTVVVRVPGTDAEAFVDLRLDENAVSDLDVLCWGAFAGPFSGPTERRDELLTRPCQPPTRIEGRITLREVVTGGPLCALVDREEVIDVVLAPPNAVVSVSGTHRLTQNDQPSMVTVVETGTYALVAEDANGGRTESRWDPDRRQVRFAYFSESEGGPGVSEFAGVTSLTYTSPQEGVLDFTQSLEFEEGEGCQMVLTVDGVVR